jgi:hypothetical protein
MSACYVAKEIQVWDVISIAHKALIVLKLIKTETNSLMSKSISTYILKSERLASNKKNILMLN